jgi:hypothetical protein
MSKNLERYAAVQFYWKMWRRLVRVGHPAISPINRRNPWGEDVYSVIKLQAPTQFVPWIEEFYQETINTLYEPTRIIYRI